MRNKRRETRRKCKRAFCARYKDRLTYRTRRTETTSSSVADTTLDPSTRQGTMAFMGIFIAQRLTGGNRANNLSIAANSPSNGRASPDAGALREEPTAHCSTNTAIVTKFCDLRPILISFKFARRWPRCPPPRVHYGTTSKPVPAAVVAADCVRPPLFSAFWKKRAG